MPDGESRETPQRPIGIVREFYDTFRWERDAEKGMHQGEVYLQDIDASALEYQRSHELRYKQYFQRNQDFILMPIILNFWLAISNPPRSDA